MAASFVSKGLSLAGSAVVLRSIVKDFLPETFKEWLAAQCRRHLARFTSDFTITIYEYDNHLPNQIFKAAEVYLAGKASATSLRASMSINRKRPLITAGDCDEVVDLFDGGVKCKWNLTYEDIPSGTTSGRRAASGGVRVRFFHLRFHKRHLDTVVNSYLPGIVDQYRSKMKAEEGIKIHTIRRENLHNGNAQVWAPVALRHPSTFDTLAMEPAAKEAIKKDLNLFLSRRDFYRKVGKAWKRGYLLHGPPGTGKSSLIAAMANYLKFHVYDLELTEMISNAELKKLLIATANRSILVIEDIDCSCSVKFKNREQHSDSDSDPDPDPDEDKKTKKAYYNKKEDGNKITLSGILNFIDGLWSSCGDERIIVFTTNHKEKLDKALLRPGRMDMHIHMSYCTFAGFKTLASNYHGIDDHALFAEIEELMKDVEATPAEVAEELLRQDDADLAFRGLMNFLVQKKKSGCGEREKKRRKLN